MFLFSFLSKPPGPLVVPSGTRSLGRFLVGLRVLMAPPRKRGLPKPLPDGFLLVDAEKKKWRLGKIIGQGGFGLIYLASQDVSRPVAADAEFVIKVEYQENGPLFSELKFYQRAAKPESMQKWKRGKRLDFLGIPKYWGSGLAEYKDLRYRFMVMDRLGTDLQEVLQRNGGQLKKTTVLQLGQRLVDVLEYIHENEYVHADVKAANLMLGHRDPEQVYLADYGLSYRYCPDGVHKEYKENPKKGHNGTIEYTSLDAHKGVAPSRRGDLQILGFCLLHWLCGSLPWNSFLKNPIQVQEAKTRLMDNLPESIQQMSASGASTDELAEFLVYVRTLDYEDKPDYQLLKQLLANDVAGGLDFSVPEGQQGSTSPEPSKREAKPGAARRPYRAKLVTPELEHEEPDSTRSKPVPARYKRGPPPTKPETKETKEVSPAAAYSLRPRPALKYTEKEDSEEDEEEEGKDTIPKRIPECYLRGPPIGPRARAKQRTESKRPNFKTDELICAVARQEHRDDPSMEGHGKAQCERERQTPGDPTECRDGVGNICSEHRNSFGTRDPGQESASSVRRNWPSGFVCVGILLLLGTVLVCQMKREFLFSR